MIRATVALHITERLLAAAAWGDLQPNRPDAVGVGDERWLSEESGTWKREDWAGSEALNLTQQSKTG
jgi:hypothetical protein